MRKYEITCVNYLFILPLNLNDMLSSILSVCIQEYVDQSQVCWRFPCGDRTMAGIISPRIPQLVGGVETHWSLVHAYPNWLSDRPSVRDKAPKEALPTDTFICVQCEYS